MTGAFQGRTATVKSNEEGILSGDRAVIAKAHYENAQDHGGLGIPPSYTEKDYLSHEMAARTLLRKYVFDTVTSEENDDPPYSSGLRY
ncbi:MAG: hypothetical protein LBH20_04110 [Treponema sp.]|nr:hypothetical protein [Treponema sp.]